MNARNGEHLEPQSRLQAAVSSLTRSEWVAWGLALLFFVGGDMATTAIGLQLGAIEANSNAVWILQTFGVLPGIFVAKSLSLALVGLCFYLINEKVRWVVPGVIALIGLAVTAWNLRIVLLLL